MSSTRCALELGVEVERLGERRHVRISSSTRTSSEASPLASASDPAQAPLGAAQQHAGGERRCEAESGGDEHAPLEPLGQGDGVGVLAAPSRRRASSPRATATVATTAMPSAPPTSRPSRPCPRRARRRLVYTTERRDLGGHDREPEADAEGEEPREQVGPVGGVARRPRQVEQPAGDDQLPDHQRRARPEAADEPGGDRRTTTSELGVAASQATPVSIAE